MKCTKIMLSGLVAFAVTANAMPTQVETKKVEPLVMDLMRADQDALKSGKKTRAEVAESAMKLADKAESEAAKLLLMKGAFNLYVRAGEFDKAIETLQTMQTAIPDMPPQSVKNIINTALRETPNNKEAARLYKLLGETKAETKADLPSHINLPSHVESKAIAASVKERSSVASILKSMIKLPGRDCWLSATELTQGQWESVMGYNISRVKGADMPVEMVSRNDCDVFLEKLNQTEEVRASRFEFRLPSDEEWDCAARTGALGNPWIKPGVYADVLDMGWCSENSGGHLHPVATKAANAFGFYDMAGNVWEWTSKIDAEGVPYTRGGSAGNTPGISWMYKIGNWSHNPRGVGLRLAAHVRSGNLGKKGSAGDEAVQRQATAGGYTWSYRVIDGGAMIAATNGLCAVSPSPKGNVSIPSTLGGVKVTSIGKHAFRECRGLTSVTIPEGVTSIGTGAFSICCELRAVKIPPSVRNIEEWAFERCYALRSVTIPPKVENIGAASFENCRELKSVTIPAQVASIGAAAFSYCSSLKQITVDSGNQSFTSIGGVLYTKDRSTLLSSPKALTSVTIPKGVTAIGAWAFTGCNDLKSVIIPEGVTFIGHGAFQDCGGLASVTIPSSVKSIQGMIFKDCRGLKSVMTLGERLEASKNVFDGCSNLKSIHVPAKAKSWAGMKDWQRIPLVFDAK